MGSHSARSGSFRPDIQGLRALAVILVVLDHARIGPFHGGFIGVDVFFVISGFLITGLLLAEADRRGRVSLLDFYARRAKRILPAATVVLAATVVAGYFLLSGIQAIRLFKDTIWATFFAANIKFARDETDYFAPGRRDPADPALLVAGGGGAVLPGVAGGRAAPGRACSRAAAGPAGRSVIRDRGDQPGLLRLGDRTPSATARRGAYFSTPARAWELGLGAATAAHAAPASAAPCLCSLPPPGPGVALIGVAAVIFSARHPRARGRRALLPVRRHRPAARRGHRGRRLGSRSGSCRCCRCAGSVTVPTRFYLWHWPALILVGEVWRTPAGWTGLLVSLAALVLADLSYRFVENPFRDRAFFKPRWRGIALYPVSVAVLGLTVFTAHAVLVQRAQREATGRSRPRRTATGPTRRSAPTDPQIRLVQASVLAAKDDADVPNPLPPGGARAGRPRGRRPG